MKLSHASGLLVLALFLSASFSAMAESPAFHVQMKVVQSGEEIATPSMLVKEGTTASVSLSGEHPVDLGLIISNVNDNEVHIMVELVTPGREMSPELLMQKDQWASVSVGELEFHIHVEDHQ